jgi:hypothetical protein
VHAQLDALGRPLGDAEQLDAVAELLGVLDVDRVELADAFDVRLSKLIELPKAIADMMLSLCAASTPSTSKVGSASA